MSASARTMLVTTITDDYYFGVSLRVWHETHSPEDISRILGHPPSLARRKGSTRGSAGSPAVYPQNYWCLDFDAEGALADRITSVAQFLQPRADAMVSLLQSGGLAEIYTFVAPELTTVVLQLDAYLLTTIGRAGVKVSIEIVPPPKGHGSDP